MKRWKEHVHASRQARLKDEIKELQRRKEHNDASINGLVNEIETAEGQNFHLKSKLNKQGQRILANFIVRFTDVAKARGFYTWKDKVDSHNNRFGFLKNCMAHWGRNLLFLSFRRWAEANHGSRKRELERRIVMQDEESHALK